jgi:peptidyl-prolyl cis-trans isomerase D
MIQQQPDSSIEMFVRNLVKNELVLKQADSAKVAIDSAELEAIRSNFTGTVQQVWTEIGIGPQRLADSAKTQAAKASLAASRVEAYMENLIFNNARFVPITPGLEAALYDKYEHRINEAGIDRALERAAKVRATLDSTRAQQQPTGQPAVPMPQMNPQLGPGQRPAQPQQQQPQQPAPAPTKRP